MFNLPPNMFNNPYLQNMNGGPKKPGWSEATPFRTVDNGHQYGSGINASAGQLYQHFARKATLDRLAGNPDAKISDYGLTPGHNVQSIEDFASRRNPQPPQIPAGGNPPIYGGGPVPPPKYPVSGFGGLGGLGPSGIFNMLPPGLPGMPPAAEPQPRDLAMQMPSGGPSQRQVMPMSNMNAGIFNMPQFNRR
jgi:hypothetical protein